MSLGSLFVFAFLCLLPYVFRPVGDVCLCNGGWKGVSSLNVFQKFEASNTQSLCTFVILNVLMLSVNYLLLLKELLNSEIW